MDPSTAIRRLVSDRLRRSNVPVEELARLAKASERSVREWRRARRTPQRQLWPDIETALHLPEGVLEHALADPDEAMRPGESNEEYEARMAVSSAEGACGPDCPSRQLLLVDKQGGHVTLAVVVRGLAIAARLAGDPR